ILSYIDLAGGIEARRHYSERFVTKAMREVVFVAPVFLGDLVTFYTRTTTVGRTSITVEVEVEVERLGPQGNRETCKGNAGKVICVAVDDRWQPVPIAKGKKATDGGE